MNKNYKFDQCSDYMLWTSPGEFTLNLEAPVTKSSSNYKSGPSKSSSSSSSTSKPKTTSSTSISTTTTTTNGDQQQSKKRYRFDGPALSTSYLETLKRFRHDMPEAQNKNYKPASAPSTSSPTTSTKSTTKSKKVSFVEEEVKPQKKDEEEDNVHRLPVLVQKYIVQILVDDCFLNTRLVSKLWCKTAMNWVSGLSINFQGLSATSSRAHTSETFLKSLATDYNSLESLTFINNDPKCILGLNRYQFNRSIYPFMSTAISKCANLKRLYVKGYPLATLSMDNSQPTTKLVTNINNNQLIDTISKHANLEELCLKSVSLDSSTMHHLLLALAENNHITTLDLAEDIPGECLQLLQQLFRQHSLRSLKQLRLSNNEQAIPLACTVRHMLQSMSQSPEPYALETLDLSNNSIDDASCLIVSSGVRGCPTLRSLLLTNNRFGNNLDGLDLGRTITSLTMSNNKIMPSGIKWIGKYLQHNTSVTSLDLSYNSLESKGAKKLAKSLSKNQVLRKLDLSFNRIESDGAVCMFEAMRTNVIDDLNIQGNMLDNTCVKPLCSALDRSSPAIHNLNLSCNRIGLIGFKSFITPLSKYSKISTQDMEGDSFDNFDESPAEPKEEETKKTKSKKNKSKKKKSSESESEPQVPESCPEEIQDKSVVAPSLPKLRLDMTHNRITMDGARKHLRPYKEPKIQ
ncbi:hypothetical protein SAMD00019534_054710, partial [Acytostelium subglobosum LB1]|uniref:hypothetical protein n=1 Tax=Acytostelium subglobosum LB1 TaxID=1410327 RepID=UPI000644B181